MHIDEADLESIPHRLEALVRGALYCHLGKPPSYERSSGLPRHYTHDMKVCYGLLLGVTKESKKVALEMDLCGRLWFRGMKHPELLSLERIKEAKDGDYAES